MTGKIKALERATNAALEKERKDREESERKAAEEWSIGAKNSSRAKAQEDKEMEKQRKAAEKAALIAQEEASMAGAKRIVKTKKSDDKDLSFLNAALANQPKTKAQKEAEQKKKLDEERKRKEAIAQEQKAARLKAQEEEIKKNALKGIVMNHTDDLMRPINNRLDDENDISASGLDSAVDALSSGLGKIKMDSSPQKRGKALFEEFSNKRLPEIKLELPGLKLSQYKERIFEEWSKCPENPKNDTRIGKAWEYDPKQDDVTINDI